MKKKSLTVRKDKSNESMNMQKNLFKILICVRNCVSFVNKIYIALHNYCVDKNKRSKCSQVNVPI